MTFPMVYVLQMILISPFTCGMYYSAGDMWWLIENWVRHLLWTLTLKEYTRGNNIPKGVGLEEVGVRRSHKDAFLP